jgi:hypothetical protein
MLHDRFLYSLSIEAESAKTMQRRASVVAGDEFHLSIVTKWAIGYSSQPVHIDRFSAIHGGVIQEDFNKIIHIFLPPTSYPHTIIPTQPFPLIL